MFQVFCFFQILLLFLWHQLSKGQIYGLAQGYSASSGVWNVRISLGKYKLVGKDQKKMINQFVVCALQLIIWIYAQSLRKCVCVL